MRNWKGALKWLRKIIPRERPVAPLHRELIGGVGEIPGDFEQAFAFENDMETEAESDDETSNLEAGIAAVNLSGERKASIQAHWSNALIVKVIGKTVGYQVMSTRIVDHYDAI
ncbi:hypothetical protein SO802_015074 [Lithocarpus litseifolius]|uniref:Uncharacterized protein n=1 Tax=Lithocarpus litseifolius TaxID=425828 RepID=A0AAW2CSQ8_9ROSI